MIIVSLWPTDRMERSHCWMGSVLRLLQFHTFVNYLAEGVSSEVINFADDTKIFRAVRKVLTAKSCRRTLQD